MKEPLWLTMAKAPWGLVGMIGMLVLMEGAVTRNKIDFLDAADWDCRRSMKAAKEARDYDVLCFGDSMVKCGLLAKGVEERSGLKVLNLGVSGSHAASSYALLRRALDLGAKPEAVIVSFHPALLRQNPRQILCLWPNLLSFAEAAWVAQAGHDPAFFGAVAVGKILPSYQCRNGIRANLLGRVSGEHDNRRYLYFLYQRNAGRNGGSHLLPTVPKLKTFSDADAEYWHKVSFPKWECHPAHLVGLEAFLDLAASRGIKVYWLLTPYLPLVQEKINSSGFDKAHSTFVASYQARHANIVVVDGRGTVADAGAFFDPMHLSASGTYAFSLAVGDALRQVRSGHLPPDRWIHTAQVRPLPLPEEFEDMNQSHGALADRARTVR